MTIARSDLARIVFRKIEDRCETIFGDSITGIVQTAKGVNCTFEHAPPRHFDAVIGADGLHSVVRQLVFGNESRFEKYLGYSVAAFEAVGYQPREENVYVNCCVRGKQVGRLSLRNNRTLFLFVFADKSGERIETQDLHAYKKVLYSQFGDVGWECPRILAAMESSNSLYFDRVSQIRMDRWSQGRVALIGDAAFGPSLLAGQGSALAMTAAYVLAGELAKSIDSPERAFERYQQLLHPFMLSKQDAAVKFAGSFAPKTSLGLFLRNQATKILTVPFVTKRVMRSALLDRIDLPIYFPAHHGT